MVALNNTSLALNDCLAVLCLLITVDKKYDNHRGQLVASYEPSFSLPLSKVRGLYIPEHPLCGKEKAKLYFGADPTEITTGRRSISSYFFTPVLSGNVIAHSPRLQNLLLEIYCLFGSKVFFSKNVSSIK